MGRRLRSAAIASASFLPRPRPFSSLQCAHRTRDALLLRFFFAEAAAFLISVRALPPVAFSWPWIILPIAPIAIAYLAVILSTRHLLRSDPKPVLWTRSRRI